MDAKNRVPFSELRLGDIVKLGLGPYADATVKNVKDGTVTFFRPYVVSSEFTYAGGVICTIGIEEFSTARTDQLWDIVRRADERAGTSGKAGA